MQNYYNLCGQIPGTSVKITGGHLGCAFKNDIKNKKRVAKN